MAVTAGQTYANQHGKKKLCLMAGATANVAAPTASTDGRPVYPSLTSPTVEGLAYNFRPPLHCTLLIKGRCTAAATLVGTFTLWGYDADMDCWFEIPVNGGTAITPVALAETSADQINYQEQFTNLGHYDRLALELASIGGAGATFDACIVTAAMGGQ